MRGTEGGIGIFRGSLDRAPSDQESVPLVKDVGKSSPSAAVGFAPGLHGGDGHLLFFRGTALMAQALDERTGDLHGEAVPLAERANFFWASRDTLVHTVGDGTSRLTWVENGKVAESVGDPDAYSAIALSPDARRIAAVKRGDTGADLWLVDVRGGRSQRLTFTGTISSSAPVWSADGQSIVFSDFGTGSDRIFRMMLNGTAEPALLYTSPDSGYVTSLSSDGRFLLHMIFDRKTRDIGLVPLDGDRHENTRLVSTPFDETDARFSPDGRWIAYKSNESGRTGIYAATFIAGAGTQAPRLGPRYLVSQGTEQISQAGNTGMFWRGDSKAIFYLTPKGLMISELTTDPGSPFSDPKLMFPITFEGGVAGAMTPDARRALVAVPVSATASGITVVLNWQASLQK
jgi:dipeptidyl aminopeptidase/acylaminoacyl peptidase